MSDTKYQNFIDALRDVTGDVESPVDHFRYVGSCECPALFRKLLPEKHIPIKMSKCLCKTKIKKQYWIYNNERDTVLTVGSSCIQRFIPQEWQSVLDSRRKKCKHCGETNTCRKDEFCFECRGGVLKFGKYKGKTYRKVLQIDPGYCRWIMGAHGFNGTVFQDWLINNSI